MERQKYILGIILSHFGALVWIWEASLYPPVTFRDTILDRFWDFFEKKLAEEIIELQDFLLGIILSHVWAFLVH